MKEEAAETNSPEESETGHDGLSRVESRQGCGQRDVLEAIKVASSYPWHVKGETSSLNEAKRAAKIVILFRLERNSDGGTSSLEAVDDAKRWQQGLEADGIGAHLGRGAVRACEMMVR